MLPSSFDEGPGDSTRGKSRATSGGFGGNATGKTRSTQSGVGGAGAAASPASAAPSGNAPAPPGGGGPGVPRTGAGGNNLSLASSSYMYAPVLTSLGLHPPVPAPPPSSSTAATGGGGNRPALRGHTPPGHQQQHGGGGGGGSSRTGMRFPTPGGGEQQHQSMAGVASTSTSSSPASSVGVPSLVAPPNASARHPSSIKFSPHCPNLYGCINSVHRPPPPPRSRTGEGTATATPSLVGGDDLAADRAAAREVVGGSGRHNDAEVHGGVAFAGVGTRGAASAADDNHAAVSHEEWRAAMPTAGANTVYDQRTSVIAADAAVDARSSHPSAAVAATPPGGGEGRLPPTAGGRKGKAAGGPVRSAMTKPGPVLLELRHLYALPDPTRRRVTGRRFGGILAGLSRGIPGSSTSSNCLSFRPSPPAGGGNGSLGGNEQVMPMQCATGLSNGVLAVHTGAVPLLLLPGEEGDVDVDVDVYDPPLLSSPASTLSVSHCSVRNTRHATSVAWRPGGDNNARHVAIGLASNRAQRVGGPRGASGEEFCCLLWDVEAQTSGGGGGGGVSGTGGVSGVRRVPAYRFARNVGVASLAWLSDGQLLGVGNQVRNLHLYDLRISGTNAPPIAVAAHSDAVSGIEVDPYRPNVFATFSGGVANEPVKLWDVRRMADGPFGEVKTAAFGATVSVFDGGGGGEAAYGGGGVGDGEGGSGGMTTVTRAPVVSAVAWSTESVGTLSVAVGDVVRHFDTAGGGGARNLVLVRSVHTHANGGRIQSMSYPPAGAKNDRREESNKLGPSQRLFPHRILTCSFDGQVNCVPNFLIAPVDISRRDGRVVHSSGGSVWFGTTFEGASAMENADVKRGEDVSATMMRRARCLHAARYSTDAAANLQMLSEEDHTEDGDSHEGRGTNVDIDQHSLREELWRLWSWIERVEYFSNEKYEATMGNNVEYESLWPANGLVDAGVRNLLLFNDDSKRSSDERDSNEVVILSPSLGCDTYDSQKRRVALSACGWTGKFGLRDVLDDCEAHGHFERSAALAVFHGELGAAVAALQRGSDAIRLERADAGGGNGDREECASYAEALQLVAMCIAGYNVHENDPSPSNVWRNACEGLLRRQELIDANDSRRMHVPYLRAACVFLCTIGRDDGYEKILEDESLSLCDRIAFACRFLPRLALRTYLDECVKKCVSTGNLEGVLITGLNKQGIVLLQSYVDRYADVQTAALVSSRVNLPANWVAERILCSEWLDSYRNLLNTWQMWQSRAMFDVGRIELLRQLKSKCTDDQGNVATARNTFTSLQGRRGVHGYSNVQQQGRIQPWRPPSSETAAVAASASIPNFPPQLYARCNFCNASLPLSKLRRQKGMANSWLSRQKPVLSCCPSCRKPLPRCAICLLPLGCLNPYLELKRVRGDRMLASTSSSSLRASNDASSSILDECLSGLANLPFAEWFTWCMRCKHGGHAHHLVGWFSNHDTCPVSDCDCRCQFDGIQKLARPQLVKKSQSAQHEEERSGQV